MLNAITWPEPGRYILAISGGVDSMVLLHAFAAAAAQRHYELVVAHFNHGLRPDAGEDQKLVEQAAADYGLEVTAGKDRLPDSSEATARTARYAFLRRTQAEHKADGIITAHHRDDLIETSVLNLARGTGRHGLAPMQGGEVIRPLLLVARAQITAYATAHDVAWREDSTNMDVTNPRNFLRHRLLPLADDTWLGEYADLVARLSRLNRSIDDVLTGYFSGTKEIKVDRAVIQGLSLDETAELIHAAARRVKPGCELSQRLLQELALFAKTGRTGQRRPLRQGIILTIYRGHCAFS